MEECVNNEDGDKKENQQRKKEDAIHRYITENKKETNSDTLNQGIEELLHYTTPGKMEEYVNDEDDDDKRKTAVNKNEGVICRDIKENDN